MTTLTDLAPLIERHWFAHGRETPIDGLLLTRAETPSGIIRSIYRPSFCLVVQGAKTTMLGERLIATPPASACSLRSTCR